SLVGVLSLDELGLDRELVPGEAHRLAREGLRHAGQLEHHAAGLHHGDPALGRTLAGAHAGLGRLLRERLVGEDVDPDLPATLDLAGHRDARGLDLTVRDPATLERLQAVLAEGHLVTALRVPAHAPAHDLAVLDALRHEHYEPPPPESSPSAAFPPVSGSD